MSRRSVASPRYAVCRSKRPQYSGATSCRHCTSPHAHVKYKPDQFRGKRALMRRVRPHEIPSVPASGPPATRNPPTKSYWWPPVKTRFRHGRVTGDALMGPHMPRAVTLVPLVLEWHHIGGRRVWLQIDQMVRRVVGRGGSGARGRLQSKIQHHVHARKTLPHACPHSNDQPATWKRVVPCVAKALTACSRGRAIRIRPVKMTYRPIAVWSCAPQTHAMPSHTT